MKETEYAGFITHLHLLLHIVIVDIESLVIPWHQFIYSLLVPDGRLAIQPVRDWYCKCSADNFVHNCTRHFRTLFVYFANCEMSILSNYAIHSLLQSVCDDKGSPWSLSVVHICSPIRKHCAPFSDTGRIHNIIAIDRNKSSVNFTGSNVFRLQKPNHASHLTVGGTWYWRVHCHNPLHSAWKRSLHQLHQATIYTLLNTPSDSSGTVKQLRGLYAQTFFTFRTTFSVCACVCVCKSVKSAFVSTTKSAPYVII